MPLILKVLHPLSSSRSSDISNTYIFVKFIFIYFYSYKKYSVNFNFKTFMLICPVKYETRFERIEYNIDSRKWFA